MTLYSQINPTNDCSRVTLLKNHTANIQVCYVKHMLDATMFFSILNMEKSQKPCLHLDILSHSEALGLAILQSECACKVTNEYSNICPSQLQVTCSYLGHFRLHNGTSAVATGSCVF